MSYKRHLRRRALPETSVVVAASKPASSDTKTTACVLPQAVQVALAGPFYGGLDYALPSTSVNLNSAAAGAAVGTADLLCAAGIAALQVGMRVQVPLGRRQLVGVVTALGQEPRYALDKLRPIMQVLDSQPIIPPVLMRLAVWGANYYHYPLGEVLLSMLPQRLRKPEVLPAEFFKELEASREAVDLQSQGSGQAGANNIEKNSSVQSGLLSQDEHEATAEQRQVLQGIKLHSGFKSHVLWGVTGSGKTEVYLQLIHQVLQRGQQALVLVPEISLTPQTVARFTERFKVPVLVRHSKLTPKAQLLSWQLQARTGAAIIIGTRSAVFTPAPNLGLIIIDEAHDSSFKQMSKWRYHARDVAVMRAKFTDIPLLLGTATPSLETLHNIERQRYKMWSLKKRATGAKAVQWRVIDQTQTKLQHGLCQPLLAVIKQHLESAGQVLIFLNRRGYAPVLRCLHCGWHAQCSACDSAMTLHYTPRHLLCHHCLERQRVPKVCPKCQQTEPVCVGQGTERLEEGLQALFPGESVVRIDRDTTQRKGELEKRLAQAADGQARILLGTQMLAKGHHFPELSLVVILDIDSAFYSVDFRSLEHLGQLLVQVAGRAGRMQRQGEVALQTHQPQNPLLQVLLQQGYAAFAQELLQQRKQHALPPFNYQILWRAQAKTAAAAKRALLFAKEYLQARSQKLGLINFEKPEIEKQNEGSQSIDAQQLQILGPVPAPMERCDNMYRAQLLIQSDSRAVLSALHQGAAQAMQQEPTLRAVRWSIDVDPVDLY